MSERAPYDPVAALYDLHWGYDFAVLAKMAIANHLVPYLPERARLLDLCCGTGLVLAHLTDLGYRACGVDESSEMLAVARHNAPTAELQQADMATFRFATPFAAVVSFYNSVNHARSIPHLQATLIQVADHLRPGGLFLFDYVEADAFENAWEWSEQIQADDTLWTFSYRYDKNTGHATCLTNRGDSIRQTSFATSQLQAALATAGLSVLSEVTMTGAQPRGGRRLVLARKL